METKEIKETNVVQFRTLYNTGVYPIKSQDLSDNTVVIYREIQPYSIDLDTGKFLNKTNKPIVTKIGTKNLQEEIVSHFKEVDIYSILERYAASGDSSILNVRQGYFGDFVNLPDNLNDMHEYLNNVIDKHADDPELVKLAMKSNLSLKDISDLIDKRIKAQVDSSNLGGNTNE